MKHKILIAAIIALTLYAGVVVGYNLKTPVAATPKTAVVNSKPDVYTLWQLTNQARVKAGLSPLRLSPKLNTSATNKCNDMVAKDYWDHKDPTGTQPWHFLDEAGYRYNTAGENLAYGYSDTTKLFYGWMISPKHKADILNNTYVDVGFSVCTSRNFVGDGAQYIVVQHFGSPR